MKRIITILAFIPTLSFGQWNQVGNSITGQAPNDQFGYATAISDDGTIVAVGANANDSNGNGSGQVRVFKDVNGVWSQIGADINGESGGDQTGQSVSLSSDGTVLAIGETFNNDLGFTSGQVRVFRNIANTWTQVGQDLYGQDFSSFAGTTVDLSADGSIVAFGAPGTFVNGVYGVGIVEVYQLQDTTWVQKGLDIEGDGSIVRFGQSISLSNDGNTIAVGQTGNPGAFPPTDTGRVKVYQYISNQWIQLGSTIPGFYVNDEFGTKVSLSDEGTILAIGSYSAEQVWVYQLVSGVWTQLGNTLISQTLADSFGAAVSLSGNGSFLAVGARFNSEEGFNKGRTYIYEYQGGTWSLVDNPITGVANQDLSGVSLAISHDGSRVAIAASYNDDSGLDAGHVRVFENNFNLGVENMTEIEQISVYPNPTTEFLQIKSNKAIQSFKILTLDGRIVEQKDVLNSSEFGIHVGDLTSSTYILMLQTENEISSFRIIKE